MEIVTGHPELLISRRENGKFEISFSHDVNVENDIQLIRESPTRIKVIETNDDVLRIAKVIGKRPVVPTSGKKRLLEAVESVSPIVTVHSQIEGIGGEAEEVPADPTTNIHLRPFGSGLRVEMLVQPFASEGPCFRPGEGGETVISYIGGKLFQTKRDLDQEKQQADKFRRRLDELAAYSKKSGKNRRFHPLAALSLKDLADDLGGFHSDKHWKAHLKRLHDARSMDPRVPSTFKAELRDYQVEGFRWLARLSHWGVGACLADDMGLGKTIQALAVMLTTAAGGPCLVVAPTSVCMNWETEALRFGPSLNIVTLGNGDREAILADLKPFDLLVVSYGLLQHKAGAARRGAAQCQAGRIRRYC